MSASSELSSRSASPAPTEASRFFTGILVDGDSDESAAPAPRTRPAHRAPVSKQAHSSVVDDDEMAQEKARERRYIHQLAHGCGNQRCNNKYCASNKRAPDWKAQSRAKIITLAQRLAKNTESDRQHFCLAADSVPSKRETSENVWFRKTEADLRIREDEIEFGPAIGKGSFGTVYRGNWLGTEVALKLLDTSARDLVKLAQREIRLLQSVRHPHVVQFMGVCATAKGEIYVVTEYLSEGDLFHLLRNKSKPLPWSLRVGWAIDVCRAFCYLHRMNIMHRDLKSLNLLVDSQNHMKICDFGFARVASEAYFKGVDPRKLMSMSFCGTQNWKAPEMIEKRPYDCKVDVFAFGIVLIEMITRITRVARTDDHGVDADEIYRHAESGCPPALTQLAIDACHVDPATRPSFAALLKRLIAVRGALEPDTLSSATASVTSSERRKSKTPSPQRRLKSLSPIHKSAIMSSSFPSSNLSDSSALSDDGDVATKGAATTAATTAAPEGTDGEEYEEYEEEEAGEGEAASNSGASRPASVVSVKRRKIRQRPGQSASGSGAASGAADSALSGASSATATVVGSSQAGSLGASAAGDPNLQRELAENVERILKERLATSEETDPEMVIELVKQAQLEALKKYERSSLSSAGVAPLTPSQQRTLRSTDVSTPQKYQLVDRLRSMLSKGSMFLKYGRHGKAHARMVYCVLSERRIYWKQLEAGKAKASDSIEFKDMRNVVAGHKTTLFIKKGNREREDLAFSILTNHRTLDLECNSRAERDSWVQAFDFLLHWQGTPSQGAVAAAKASTRRGKGRSGAVFPSAIETESQISDSALESALQSER